jgi:hypothetical protein
MNFAPQFLAAQNTFFLSIPAGHISNAWFVQCLLLGTPPGTCRPSVVAVIGEDARARTGGLVDSSAKGIVLEANGTAVQAIDPATARSVLATNLRTQNGIAYSRKMIKSAHQVRRPRFDLNPQTSMEKTVAHVNT